MITVTALQRVKPGKDAELISLMQGLTDDIRANEPGCLRFEHLEASDEPGIYIVIEQYADAATFEAHKTTSYLKAFIPKLLAVLVDPPQVQVYGEVAGETAIRRQPEAGTFFHVGVVVKDLAAATKQYSEVLGVTFTEPATFEVPRIDDPEPHPNQTVVAVFSREGPPYYELIQADLAGPFGPQSVGQILYVGVWEPDVPARVARLEGQGVGFEALLKDSEGVPFVCLTKAEALEGMRIEWVGTGARAGIEDWVRTGVWASSVAD